MDGEKLVQVLFYDDHGERQTLWELDQGPREEGWIVKLVNTPAAAFHARQCPCWGDTILAEPSQGTDPRLRFHIQYGKVLRRYTGKDEEE